ncbi:hypothetical protein OBBRIDRAFT_534396 [Obba rivulosa]|uniref:Uncharacterized protein n=1 Tax=Obba rivulosa TaxID=1052685 RepID=A0A8E2DTF8_9APHY|nr:hypothetical protein OBBRIDRAFT_534396 [Obba rivulosa]
MSLASKLLCRVNSNSPANMFSSSNNSSSDKPSKPEDAVKAFISQDPNSPYTFDSERGAEHSKLCRESKDNGRECIELQMQATKLFQAMQAQGFFCALPSDPSRTYMECKRIPQ